tara:strand:+ start:118 stop:642 length:525 start_codon:yes stop_codon:yes gene_type:complete
MSHSPIEFAPENTVHAYAVTELPPSTTGKARRYRTFSGPSPSDIPVRVELNVKEDVLTVQFSYASQETMPRQPSAQSLDGQYVVYLFERSKRVAQIVISDVHSRSIRNPDSITADKTHTLTGRDLVDSDVFDELRKNSKRAFEAAHLSAIQQVLNLIPDETLKLLNGPSFQARE